MKVINVGNFKRKYKKWLYIIIWVRIYYKFKRCCGYYVIIILIKKLGYNCI